MKRSVILMGGKTYVISLPSQWVRKYNIQKGEELELEERGNTIVVSTEKFVKGNEVEVNFSELFTMLGRTVGATYKAGYDKIKITFSHSSQLDIIEKTLKRTCIGFEIVDQGKKYIIIKNIVQIDQSEFNNSLRRLFYTLEVMGNDLITAKSSEELIKVIEKDDQVNKLADFCRRILNKEEVKNLKKPHTTYYIIEQLERIGDLYKKLASYLKEGKISFNENIKSLFQETHVLLVLYRGLFYNFELERVEAFGKSFATIKEKIQNAKKEHKELSAMILFIEFLIEHIFDMNGALLTAKI